MSIKRETEGFTVLLSVLRAPRRRKVQYKSLKVDRNGGKSKKSKTIFVASPIEDLDSFYLKLFPE